MNLVIEEIVSIYPVEVTEEVFVIEISEGTNGITVHNELSGLNAGDYKHLTAAEKEKFDAIPETFSNVATTGSYNDLTDKPTVPTNTSQLTNDSGFITIGDVPNPDLSGLVPYTGAVQNVDLGDNELKSDVLEVSLTPTGVVDTGKIVWNASEGTFDMGLLNDVTLQVGQELHFYAKASEIISNGDCVQFAGSQGDHLLIKKAVPSEINANPEYFIGIATQDFANNEFGYVTVFGKVRGLNTTTWTQPVLYFASDGIVNGALTETQPTAPNAKIIVCAVVRNHTTQGILLVRPHTMPRIEDIQNVNTSLEKTSPITGDKLLLKDSVDGVYKHVDWGKTQNGADDILIEVSELPTVDILTTKIYVLPNGSWNWYNGTTWVTNESGGSYLINQIEPTASVTGTTAETILYTWFVPANTFSETDRIVVKDFTCVSNGTVLNNAFARIRFNTVNVLPTTSDKLYATFTLPTGSGNRYFRAERTIDFVDSKIKGYFSLSSSYTDKLTALYTSNYFDTTVDNYLFFTIQLGNVNDSVYMKNLIIRR